MRQKRWLKLMKDYELTIHYHPEKVNIMTDALSCISGGSLAALTIRQSRLLRDLEEMQIEVRFRNSSNLISRLNQVSIHFDLYNKIKKAQQENLMLRMIQ